MGEIRATMENWKWDYPNTLPENIAQLAQRHKSVHIEKAGDADDAPAEESETPQEKRA